jgi:RNA-directed DNA polymerase
VSIESQFGRKLPSPSTPLTPLIQRPIKRPKTTEFAALIHYVSEAQARQVRDGLAQRLARVGLELHPDKTRIVYCQDADRREAHSWGHVVHVPGVHVPPEAGQEQAGEAFRELPPGGSKDAVKAMGREMRSWHIARRSDKSLTDLARMFNSIVQGWINY